MSGIQGVDFSSGSHSGRGKNRIVHIDAVCRVIFAIQDGTVVHDLLVTGAVLNRERKDRVPAVRSAA